MMNEIMGIMEQRQKQSRIIMWKEKDNNNNDTGENIVSLLLSC